MCVYTFKLMLIKFIGCFVHKDCSLHPFVGLVFIHFEVLVQFCSIDKINSFYASPSHLAEPDNHSW